VAEQRYEDGVKYRDRKLTGEGEAWERMWSVGRKEAPDDGKESAGCDAEKIRSDEE
jgi:hypothetical protein